MGQFFSVVTISGGTVVCCFLILLNILDERLVRRVFFHLLDVAGALSLKASPSTRTVLGTLSV